LNYTYSRPNVAVFDITSPHKNPAEESSDLGFEGTLISSATRDISTHTSSLYLICLPENHADCLSGLQLLRSDA